MIYPGPLLCDFAAPSTIDVGLGHVTYLANGMLEDVVGAVDLHVFEGFGFTSSASFIARMKHVMKT